MAAKPIQQREAARRLGLSARQVKRRVHRYRAEGAAGRASRRPARQPHNAIAEGVRQAVMALVREHFADFGPTLAGEKLAEHHGHGLSVETFRHVDDHPGGGLREPRGRKRARIHPRRPRRPCLGEPGADRRSITTPIKGDISEWFRRGYFRFGLTALVISVRTALRRISDLCMIHAFVPWNSYGFGYQNRVFGPATSNLAN